MASSPLHKTAVLNVVGLTPSLIGPHTPRIAAFAKAGKIATIAPSIPAVTCSVQATYLTGTPPAEHGIVGNGWYFRDECEVRFWHQSDKLVQRPRIWEAARALDPSFTCAILFWWYAMYSGADIAVTPRPMYPADGRKLPDVWTWPPDLRSDLQRELGQFPLFHFWGPATSIKATQWIADAAIRVDARHNPTLSLIYLPHLDYVLQKLGPDPKHPDVARDLHEIDAVAGQLIDHFTARDARIVILSEYGITAVSRPVHLNRMLRQVDLITVREELGRELLDAGASKAFAVADHQVAHIYVNDPSSRNQVRALLGSTPGVGRILDEADKRGFGLNHPRSGEFVVLADPDAWFTYYYWLDDRRAPDFARTVDIHRKPGYDPAELFLNPKLAAPKLKILWTLLKRKLGQRAPLDVIGLDPCLVRGSHGLLPPAPQFGPLFITQATALLDKSAVDATEVHDLLLRHLRN